MRELPKNFSPDGREDLIIRGNPTQMPAVPDGKVLVCEFVIDHHLPSWNRYFACDDLGDMQHLFAGHAAGGSMLINWFLCPSSTLILVTL
jgi:hypothetical protein